MAYETRETLAEVRVVLEQQMSRISDAEPGDTPKDANV
jgi:hypothetical protein